MYACANAGVDVVAELLRHGADTLLSDRQGMTSLHYSAHAASLPLMEAVLGAAKPGVVSIVNKRESSSGNTGHCHYAVITQNN
jgi:ankyrin repeat protein